MATRVDFKIGRFYSFNTHAPEITGVKIIGVECVALMNAQTAISDGLDVLAMHERIKAHLPSGANQDPMSMSYIKIRNNSGYETILAIDWINLDTVEENTNNKITVTINGVSASDVDIIRKALVIQGYTDISIVLGDSNI